MPCQVKCERKAKLRQALFNSGNIKRLSYGTLNFT